MKLKIYIWISLLAVTMVWTGCKDDDKDVKIVNLSFTNAIYESGNIMSLQLKDTETLQLEPFFMPRNATKKELTYEILGTGVASVSADGVITPLVSTPETGEIPEPLGIDTLIAYTTDGSGAFVRYPVKVFSYVVLVSSITLKADGLAPIIEQNATFDLSKQVTVLPADALDNSVTYTSSDPDVATVDPVTGIVTAIQPGQAIITIKANDRSGVTEESRVTVVERFTGPRNLDREGWIVTVSHELPVDAAISNAPESLIDGNINSCLSLVKPGGTNEGVSVGSNEEVFFILDLGEEQEFEYFRIIHRDENRPQLRVWEVSFYGSNNGKDFVEIQKGIVIPEGEGGKQDTGPVLLNGPAKYRYVKMTYDRFALPPNGNTMQIAEFYLGYIVE